MSTQLSGGRFFSPALGCPFKDMAGDSLRRCWQWWILCKLTLQVSLLFVLGWGLFYISLQPLPLAQQCLMSLVPRGQTDT